MYRALTILIRQVDAIDSQYNGRTTSNLLPEDQWEWPEESYCHEVTAQAMSDAEIAALMSGDEDRQEEVLTNDARRGLSDFLSAIWDGMFTHCFYQ